MVPSTIEIGPHTYDVSVDPSDIDELAPDAFAVIDEASLLIAVEPSQDDSQMRESLLHEALHAVAYLAGFPDDTVDAALVETFVDRMSPLLLDVLRRNPALVGFLLEP